MTSKKIGLLCTGALLACNILWIVGCDDSQIMTSAEEMESAIAQIYSLHERQREVHFDEQAEEFASLLSDDHISVNRGSISKLSRSEHIERFQNYFSAVEFEKWDDVNEPIIHFSDDFSMAYTVVDKEVVIRMENESGDTIRQSTNFAWVAIYKKYDDKWKIDCVASTNKASQILE